ncbi:hypothetical protein [Arenimonas daejeonensis]|uniref:hypothetical protein n=1 Tax=Arenimonas daejeonensis TaxID=370777 RepID=UPI0011BF8F0D|nr:hypothetical protein [Arenimonas daejeonensis]
MLTMLLGGLWHGASWNFVFWGGLHGAALVAHKEFARITRDWPRSALAMAAWVLCAWALTQSFVLLAWVPFRAQDFGDSLQVFAAFSGLRADAWLARADVPYFALLAPLLLDTLVLGIQSDRRWFASRVPALPAWAMALGAGAAAAVLIMVMSLEVSNFIYFQF